MRTRGLKPKLLSALIGTLAASGAMGQNLPVLSSVVSGSATTSVAGSTLTVNNSASAILDWSKFSIASGFTTNFVQPSAASSVLNRVVGADPSSILGSLISNGKVFLINPNGIVFGQGSQVNVGGLVASTAPLSNADFLAGNLSFGTPSATGAIDVSGSITAVDSIHMTANLITVGGSIQVTSPTGTMTLNANFGGAAGGPAIGGGLQVNPLLVPINTTGSNILIGGNFNIGSGNSGIVLNTAGINPTGSGAITLTSTAQKAVLISTTSTPGVQFVVPVLPTGTLGTAINSQGQISLLGNQAVIGGQPVAVTASVGPDGMVRLTAKP